MISYFRLMPLTFLFFGFVFLSSCETEDGHTAEHAEARGVVLRMNGVEIARLDSTILTGQITIAANNALSDHIDVWFIADDVDRDLFQPDEANETLRLTVSDTTFCSVFQEEDDPDEKWGFHLIGKTAGSTSLKVQIYHVDHPDYTSPVNIPIVVQNP